MKAKADGFESLGLFHFLISDLILMYHTALHTIGLKFCFVQLLLIVNVALLQACCLIYFFKANILSKGNVVDYTILVCISATVL